MQVLPDDTSINYTDNHLHSMQTAVYNDWMDSEDKTAAVQLT